MGAEKVNGLATNVRRSISQTLSAKCDLMHRDLWTEELSGTRVLRDVPTLD